MNLEELLADVEDARSFLVFARRLRGERMSASSSMRDAEWENLSAPQFLEAGIAWAESSRFGASQGLDGENPWKLFAVFLYCGRACE